MSPRSALGLTAGALGAAAGILAMMASSHYSAMLSYYRSAEKAQEAIGVPSGLAWVCLAGAVLAAILAAAAKPSAPAEVGADVDHSPGSGSGPGSGDPGDL